MPCSVGGGPIPWQPRVMVPIIAREGIPALRGARLAATKGAVVDTYTSQHVLCSADCPSVALTAPSVNKTSHQLCGSNLSRGAVCALVAADSRSAFNGLAYRFDRRPGNRKCLDKETLS